MVVCEGKDELGDQFITLHRYEGGPVVVEVLEMLGEWLYHQPMDLNAGIYPDTADSGLESNMFVAIEKAMVLYAQLTGEVPE